jgi:hypothetical protein
MTLLDRQVAFTDYLVAGFSDLGLRGFALAGACAVTGSATQENLCKPVTLGRKDHGSDGVLQWRDSSATARRLTGNPDLDPGIKWGMQPWCLKHFGDWKTLKAQAAFTLYETARDYPALDMELRTGLEGVKPGDVRKVLDYKTQRFQDDFERPNKAFAGLANRQKHAASVYVVMSGGKLPTIPPKPTVPPVITGGVGVGAGTAAVGGAVIAANNGATDMTSIVLFGLAMVLAVVVIFLMRPAKAAFVPATVVKRSPLDRLTAALEQRAIINAEVAEAADALKDSVQASGDLLAEAGETFLTIEHQPAAQAVIVLGNPPDKPA